MSDRSDRTGRPLNHADLLDAVPMANQAVREEATETGVVLYVPLARRWWMSPPVSWLLPFRRERGIALDRFGREVWRECDGRRTLEQIIERFAQRHHLRFHQARLAVMQFVRVLSDRKLIAVVVPQDDRAEPADDALVDQELAA